MTGTIGRWWRSKGNNTNCIANHLHLWAEDKEGLKDGLLIDNGCPQKTTRNTKLKFRKRTIEKWASQKSERMNRKIKIKWQFGTQFYRLGYYCSLLYSIFIIILLTNVSRLKIPTARSIQFPSSGGNRKINGHNNFSHLSAPLLRLLRFRLTDGWWILRGGGGGSCNQSGTESSLDSPIQHHLYRKNPKTPGMAPTKYY